jgi:hypothetical protein
MGLGHIRQKIVEFQRGEGADPILIMFGALAIVIALALAIVFTREFLLRRSRRPQRSRHTRKNHSSHRPGLETPLGR